MHIKHLEVYLAYFKCTKMFAILLHPILPRVGSQFTLMSKGEVKNSYNANMLLNSIYKKRAKKN